MKKFLIILFFVVFLLGSLVFINYVKDPLSSLRGQSLETKVIQEKIYLVPDGKNIRKYMDIVLKTKDEKEIHFTLSLPLSIPEGGLGCAFIVDGLETGRTSLGYIKGQQGYALIAYEYPPILKKLKGISSIRYIWGIRKAALHVPADLLTIVKWVQKESWYDKDPISFLGFSFGAQFIPPTYRLAEEENISFGPSVLAYGGGSLYEIFYALPGNSWIKAPRAWLAAQIFRPLEPALHVPHIKGEFLIINAKKDKVIPFKSALKLQALMPEPKTIINLESGHLKPGDEKTIQMLMKISKEWLSNKRKDAERVTQ